MKARTLPIACVLAAALPLAGCTWVPLTSGGETVRVVTDAGAEPCERIGRTRSRTTAKIGFIPRRDTKVAEELEALARNEAAAMGGNAVAPLDEPADGVQNFAIYRCP
jgi:hypothetical protein